MSSSLRLELTDRGGVPPEQHQRRQRKTPRELKREQRKRHAACASSPRDALAAVETNVEAVSAASPPTDPPRTGAVVAVAWGLLVVGGNDHADAILFEEESGRWFTLPGQMPTWWSGHGLTTIPAP